MNRTDAWQLFELKKYYEAKICWNEIIKHDPSAEHLSGLAYTLVALKEFEEAKTIYKQLWSTSKSHIWLHQLCMVERAAGNYHEALKLINQEYSLIAEHEKLYLAANLYEKGKLLQLLGEINHSLDIAKECWKYSRDCSDLVMKGCAQRLFGDIFRAKGLSTKFLAHAFQAADYFTLANECIGAQEIFLSIRETSHNFIIRQAVAKDAEAIHKAHMRSIREVCSNDYTKEQINAWSGRDFNLQKWISAIQNDLVLVCEIDSKIFGYGHLRLLDNKSDAEILGLYLNTEAKGLGVAKCMVEMFKNEVLDKNCSKISACSTITAETFYQAQGFYNIGSRVDVVINGAKIPAIPMEMILTQEE